jgi:FMN phosphatase YigB (HAD superfamily)
MITTIFFDLGNVLINFSHEILIDNIQKITQLPKQKVESLLSSFSSWEDYELGLISTEQFCQAFRLHFDTLASSKQIGWACCEIFSPNLLCIDLLKKTRKRNFKLGLISNTCALHIEYLKNKYPIFDLFHITILSYQLQLRKPNIEIFKRALTSIASCPQECLFIDDITLHVDAALSCGIKGIVFKNASLLEKEFSVLGIDL